MLKENIASLLKSNYAFELIIIDDGSKDGTEEVVKSFNDSRLVYYKHSCKYGYAKSINEGIRLAKNSQILLLEDDAFILNTEKFFRTLLLEMDHKKIIATHLLLKGKKIRLTLLGKLKKFFAEPLAKEIYLPSGQRRKIVPFCNACCSFNRNEIKTRFDESTYVGNAFGIESDFQIRARREGATIIYNPSLLIDHKRHSVGGNRIRDRDDFLYQCMVNYTMFLKKNFFVWNIYFYILLKILAHPKKWYVFRKAIGEIARAHA